MLRRMVLSADKLAAQPPLLAIFHTFNEDALMTKTVTADEVKLEATRD
jgi:hypothetical protein